MPYRATCRRSVSEWKDFPLRERTFVRRRWQKIAGPVQLRDPSVRLLACPGGKKSYSHVHYLKAAWGQPSRSEKLTDKVQPYGLS